MRICVKPCARIALLVYSLVHSTTINLTLYQNNPICTTTLAYTFKKCDGLLVSLDGSRILNGRRVTLENAGFFIHVHASESRCAHVHMCIFFIPFLPLSAESSRRVD